MKKILIIGSNSFSGSTFAKYCLSIGHEVHGVSRSIEPSKIFLPHYWSNPQANFKFLQLDLNFDQKKLTQLILDQDYSCIFNFAAQSMVGESWSNPKDWLKTNVLSVSELLINLSKIKNIPRFVHVSTPEVYGSTSTWINEESPFNPSTPYAVSRSAGDMLFKIYAKNFGFPVIFTRAANVFGPGQQLYRIIPRTIFRILNKKKLELHGGGKSKRSFIYMDDVAKATYDIGIKGGIGETYHISTNRLISIKELVELICKEMGEKFENCVTIGEERVGKDQGYYLNSDKLRGNLDWKDLISLEEGIQKTIDWVYSNNGKLLNESEDYVHKP